MRTLLPGRAAWPLVALLPFTALAQQPAPAAAPCGCVQNFDRMTELIRDNYSGYPTKVTAATRPRLDSLTRVVRARAAAATPAQCPAVLQQWVDFFRDGHVQVGVDFKGAAPADIRAYFAPEPHVTAKELQKLQRDRVQAAPFGGEWVLEGGKYRLRFRPAGANRWEGVVTQADSVWWVPGQIKTTIERRPDGSYTAAFRLRDHSVVTEPVSLSTDGRQLSMRGFWTRAGEAAATTSSQPAAAAAAPADGLRFTMLDDTTALYRIPTFDGSQKTRIDSTTAANRANLSRARLLILDVRGNGGGSDACYASLVPYYYTNPIRTDGVEIRATPLNTKRFDLYADLIRQLPPDAQAEFAAQRRKEEAHLGEWVMQTDSVNVQTATPAPNRPARVAILQDGHCGSTTEQFLLESQQSTITTRFGQPSAGVLDFANMNEMPLACQHMALGWATSRSRRVARGAGIDNVGVQPDVRLAPTTPDAVAAVRAWYRQAKR